MTPNQKTWSRARDQLAAAVSSLGYPEDLADLIAKQLGSPKAIDRMTSYIRQAKPRSMEMLIDEMLAIQSEIDAWKAKKAGEEANAKNNMFLNRQRDDDE